MIESPLKLYILYTLSCLGFVSNFFKHIINKDIRVLSGLEEYLTDLRTRGVLYYVAEIRKHFWN